MNGSQSRFRWVLLLGLAPLVPGCQMGPRAMSVGHPEYASAVGKVMDEQLLLNLVRLRYRATPVWLEIASISTQFEASASGDFSAAFNEDVGFSGAENPDAFGLGTGIGYAERPTISYSILGGEQFIKRLLKPISVTGVSLLADGGWRADRVLLLTVERMNGLKNAPRASGPTPTDVPEFLEFQEAARLIWRLDRESQLDFEFSTRTEKISDPIPLGNVDGEMLINAAKASSEFRLDEVGQSMYLTQEERVLIMRLAEGAAGLSDVARLRELLKLNPEELRYDLVDPADGDYDPLAQNENLRSISIDTRSLLGVMYYLANGVAVPADHMVNGPVTQTLDEAGLAFDWGQLLDGFFEVHYSEGRPSNAAVSVRYRGLWFYIADDDESTLSTFALLHQLASLTSGERQGVAPVLTLPVGS